MQEQSPLAAAGHKPWIAAGCAISRRWPAALALLAGLSGPAATYALARPHLAGAEATWPISLGAVGLIAALWTAGAAVLIQALCGPQDAAAAKVWRPGWLKFASAFAIGPLLVCIFFFVIGLAQQGPHPGIVSIMIVGGSLIAMWTWQARLRPLAEAMLVSFFLWMALLIAPTFLPDPVNGSFVSVVFWLLNKAGLVA